MSVSRDEKRGTWTVQCWYRDWRGERHKKTKRGFASRSAARKWERSFLSRIKGASTMTLADFWEVYEQDVRPHLKVSTWDTKEHMVRTKILPYLSNRRINEITSADVITWENELSSQHTPTGESYSPRYLNTLCSQLSAILNHAMAHYGLASNPVRAAGKIGAKGSREMSVWTKDQYLAFSRAIMDKPDSWTAFELLYWTGIRKGELLALVPDDLDLKEGYSPSPRPTTGAVARTWSPRPRPRSPSGAS